MPYRFVDLDCSAAARARVRTLQRGGRQVPTVVLPDGTVLVVPSAHDLAERLVSTEASG